MIEKPARGDVFSLVDFVVECIHKGIRAGRYVPGQRLVESDLTHQLGVSRGPLREAMRRLSTEGLVTIEPHKGVVVRKLSRGDVSEIFLVRELLEGRAASLAAKNIDKNDNRERLLTFLDKMEKHYNDNDILLYMENNEKFHDLIIEFSGISYFGTMIAQLRPPLYRYQVNHLMNLTSKRRSMKDHKIIAAAILDANSAKAQKSMLKHISNARNFMEILADN